MLPLVQGDAARGSVCSTCPALSSEELLLAWERPLQTTRKWLVPGIRVLQSCAAAEMITTFLKASSHNLKYVGIDALSRIVRINANYANEHQIAVIDCLEDPDDTLKKKTLELLFKMTNPNNVEVRRFAHYATTSAPWRPLPRAAHILTACH